MTSLVTFRQLRNAPPLTTVWHIGAGLSAIGTLIWVDGQPQLELFIDVQVDVAKPFSELSHPILDATRPPLQADISGHAGEFGPITLDRCFRKNVRDHTQPGSGRAVCCATFQPTRIWFGNKIEDAIVTMELSDTRLGGYFRTPGLQVSRRFSQEYPSVFELLGNPAEVWSVHCANGKPIALGSTPFSLRLSSNVSTSTSHVSGQSISSVTVVQISSSEPAHLSAYENIKTQLEQLLSIFGLEDFRFERCSYHSKSLDSNALAWSLGDRGFSFEPPMQHQILVDFSDQAILRSACQAWFDASEVVQLSRWLFCRALSENDVGLGRFIGAAQAMEVLGRELTSQAKIVMPAVRKKTVKVIGDALRKEQTDEKFVARIEALVNNSNVASFPDFLRDMIQPLVERLFPMEADRVRAFCKLIADTRNDIVHMTDNREQLEAAFARVPKLSLKMCWWYALIQANLLGLPLDAERAMSFHVNNRNARHGLPNEVLQRL